MSDWMRANFCCSQPTCGSMTGPEPVAVPTGPAVVTSTLEVSGAPAYLLNLDLDTFLTTTTTDTWL